MPTLFSKGPLLYCITDRRRDINYEEMVKEMCIGGADIIQFRDKDLSDKEFLQISKRLREITKKYKKIFIINDRFDIALLVSADGIHLGENDIPPDEIRKIKKRNFIIGVSTHSINDAMKIKDVDYISFGPIFRSPTKPDLKPAGLEKLKILRYKINIPIVAIGGINEENIKDVIKTNVNAVAVISAICDSDNIIETTKKLKNLLVSNRAL